MLWSIKSLVVRFWLVQSDAFSTITVKTSIDIKSETTFFFSFKNWNNKQTLNFVTIYHKRSRPTLVFSFWRIPFQNNDFENPYLSCNSRSVENNKKRTDCIWIGNWYTHLDLKMCQFINRLFLLWFKRFEKKKL